MTTDPRKIKNLLGADLHKALNARPDKDPRKDPQTGEKLWIRASSPLVDYLYNGNLTLQQITDNGNTITNPIIVNASGSQFQTLSITPGPLDMLNSKIIHLATPAVDADAATKAYVDQNFTVMREPTGFPNRTDSSINFRDDTRVFEIEETGTDFDYYIKGTKYTISGSSVQISDTEGIHFFYLDSAGNLVTTPTFVGADIYFNNVYVSVVYWDATNNTAIYVGDERHGLTMDGDTHKYLHDINGTRWEEGLALNTFDADGSGNDETAAQFGYTAGEIHDEDLEHNIPADTSPAQIPVFYRLGAAGDWRATTATDYPLVYGADYAGTLAAWNEFTGGAWQLTEVGNLQFVLTHYFATNDITYPIIGVCGQDTYSTLNSAREGAATELNDLMVAGLPFEEFKSIATVIFQTGNSYNNTPKARVRTTDLGDNYIDWRFSAGASSAGGQINDHSQLTGLDNDDHLQYVPTDGSRVITGTQQISGSLAVDGNIRTNSNMHLNFNGPDGDSFVYFYDNANPTGAFIRFTNGTNSFDLTANVRATQNLWSDNDVYVNHTGADGDSFIYFWEGGSATGRHLKWDDGSNQFEMNDDLSITGTITASVDVVGAEVKSNGHMYINHNGPDGDSNLYFFDSSSPTGAFIRFTNGTNSFDMTANIRATQNLWSDNDVYVNHNGPDGDSFLYFYNGSSATGASLMWDDSPGTFKFNEPLDMSSKKITSVLDPTADQDAATKKYVDDNAGGSFTDVKSSVIVPASHWWPDPTGNPAVMSRKGMYPVLLFDNAIDTDANYSFIVPQDMKVGSTIDVIINWTYSGAQENGDVTWAGTYINVADGEAVDGSTTTIKVTTAGSHTTGLRVISQLATGITGAVADDVIGMRLWRDVSLDDLVPDAQVMSVRFEYTKDKLGEAI